MHNKQKNIKPYWCKDNKNWNKKKRQKKDMSLQK